MQMMMSAQMPPVSVGTMQTAQIPTEAIIACAIMDTDRQEARSFAQAMELTVLVSLPLSLK